MEKAFVCDACGPIDHIHFDGYAFGDRVLEGVIFRAAFKNGKLVVTPIEGWGGPYLRTLSKAHWQKEAEAFAAENDVAQCPKCGADVDAQPGQEKEEKKEPVRVPLVRGPELLSSLKKKL